MLIIKQHRIYRIDIKANRHLLYVFGDNLDRVGFGGQAKEMRGESNSFGVATKRTPEHGHHDNYFHDEDENVKEIIRSEFIRLQLHLCTPHHNDLRTYQYEGVVFPLDGIGTGLAKLSEYAPKLLEYINWQIKGLENL